MNVANDDLPKIKTSLKGPIVSGLTILLIFIVGATVWASSAKLASAIIAVGQLKVDSNRKQIQHLDGGIVNEIIVSDGQRVKKGDTLVILDPVQAKSSLGIVAGALFTAELKRSRLQAERDNTDQPDFTRFLHREHEDKNSLIDAQQSLFSIRRSVQVSQQEILHQQIENLKSQILGFESQQASTQTQIEIRRKRVPCK